MAFPASPPDLRRSRGGAFEASRVRCSPPERVSTLVPFGISFIALVPRRGLLADTEVSRAPSSPGIRPLDVPLRRPAGCASTPRRTSPPIGPTVPPVESRAVRVVSHHLDGLLRAAVAGLLRPATDRGVACVSGLARPVRRPEQRAALPACGVHTLRRFPLAGSRDRITAARCPPAVPTLPGTHLANRPFPDDPLSAASRASADFRALLHRRVRCRPHAVSSGGRSFLPWAWFPSEVPPCSVAGRMTGGPRRSATRDLRRGESRAGVPCNPSHRCTGTARAQAPGGVCPELVVVDSFRADRVRHRGCRPRPAPKRGPPTSLGFLTSKTAPRSSPLGHAGIHKIGRAHV